MLLRLQNVFAGYDGGDVLKGVDLMSRKDRLPVSLDQMAQANQLCCGLLAAC